jgi:probable F420-dependent oxidoreductase
MNLGQVGIWTFALDLHPSTHAQETAAELESLGYSAIWVPEALGREALTNAALLLAATKRTIIASGIASIWARDPMAAASGQKTLCEAYDNRFLLGLGVSHGPMAGMRGHTYEKPLSFMRRYLEQMDVSPFLAPLPSRPTRRVLAALAPKMLELAKERAHGSHTYFVPPEHTAYARKILGPKPILAVEQAVVIETDPQLARAVARQHMSTYLNLPNYVNNLIRLGFKEEDAANGGSNRLVDAIVAWGDVAAIEARVRAHQAAGASHVCIQVIDPDPRVLPLWQWRELAPALVRTSGDDAGST